MITGCSRSRDAQNLVITRAPLRISFVGGGSDIPCYSLGATVSCTIDKYVYCVAKWRLDKKVYVSWMEKEVCSVANDVKHGIIRECLRYLGIYHGIEILTFADVPGVGSGLGSSAATTLAVLKALYSLLGLYDVPKERIAEDAAYVELTRLNRRGGRQDQYASAFGGLRYLKFYHGTINGNEALVDWDGRGRIEDLNVLSRLFMLFRPTVENGRDSDEILADCGQNSDFGDKCFLLATDFVRNWNDKDAFKYFGDLIWKHGKLKDEEFPKHLPESLVELSNSKLENWKLCGAGGTGHLLVFSDFENQDRVRSYFEEIWGPELPFGFVTHGVEVVHSC